MCLEQRILVLRRTHAQLEIAARQAREPALGIGREFLLAAEADQAQQARRNRLPRLGVDGVRPQAHGAQEVDQHVAAGQHGVDAHALEARVAHEHRVGTAGEAAERALLLLVRPAQLPSVGREQQDLLGSILACELSR